MRGGRQSSQKYKRISGHLQETFWPLAFFNFLKATMRFTSRATTQGPMRYTPSTPMATRVSWDQGGMESSRKKTSMPSALSGCLPSRYHILLECKVVDSFPFSVKITREALLVNLNKKIVQCVLVCGGTFRINLLSGGGGADDGNWVSVHLYY